MSLKEKPSERRRAWEGSSHLLYKRVDVLPAREEGGLGTLHVAWRADFTKVRKIEYAYKWVEAPCKGSRDTRREMQGTFA